ILILASIFLMSPPATPHTYTLSLHDALPICWRHPDSGNQTHHRYRQWERRSGKIDRGCEPGGCITKCRGARWSLRLRHLWPQYFAHVRFARATDGDGRKSHSADRTIRIEANVDGISAR